MTTTLDKTSKTCYIVLFNLECLQALKSVYLTEKRFRPMTTTATANPNVDNNTNPAPEAPKAKEAKPKKNGQKPRRRSTRPGPSLTGLELFIHCVDGAIENNVDELPANTSLFDRHEAVRSACRWGENKRAPRMFESNPGLLDEAVNYARSQSIVLSVDEVVDHLVPALSNEETQRSRCATVDKVIEREADAEDHGGLTKSGYLGLLDAVTKCLPPRGEAQFANMFKHCGEYKESEAEKILSIIRNDERYTSERRGVLLTWLEARVAEFCGSAEKAQKWMDQGSMPQRPQRKNGYSGHRSTSNVQEMKPSTKSEQYKVCKTKSYEPPQEEIEALAEKIVAERKEAGKNIAEKDALKQARGRLIQAHNEAERQSKKTAKRQVQEAAEAAAKAKAEAAAKAKAEAAAKNKGKGKGKPTKAERNAARKAA